jgi:hypothetical protein
LSTIGFSSPAYAADIIPKLTEQNDFFYGILLVALLVIFFLLGILLGRNLGKSKKAVKENEKPIIEEPLAKPIDPVSFGQDRKEIDTNQSERQAPRNPRNRYYNNYY